MDVSAAPPRLNRVRKVTLRRVVHWCLECFPRANNKIVGFRSNNIYNGYAPRMGARLLTPSLQPWPQRLCFISLVEFHTARMCREASWAAGSASWKWLAGLANSRSSRFQISVSLRPLNNLGDINKSLKYSTSWKTAKLWFLIMFSTLYLKIYQQT